jgi:hypothetical protein
MAPDFPSDNTVKQGSASLSRLCLPFPNLTYSRMLLAAGDAAHDRPRLRFVYRLGESAHAPAACQEIITLPAAKTLRPT